MSTKPRASATVTHTWSYSTRSGQSQRARIELRPLEFVVKLSGAGQEGVATRDARRSRVITSTICSGPSGWEPG